MAGDRSPDRIRVTVEQVADRGTDEVAAIGVKAFLDQQIDMAKIDIAEIDGDFFAVAAFSVCPTHF
jgi:hypothetical protein